MYVPINQKLTGPDAVVQIERKRNRKVKKDTWKEEARKRKDEPQLTSHYQHNSSFSQPVTLHHKPRLHSPSSLLHAQRLREHPLPLSLSVSFFSLLLCAGCLRLSNLSFSLSLSCALVVSVSFLFLSFLSLSFRQSGTFRPKDIMRAVYLSGRWRTGAGAHQRQAPSSSSPAGRSRGQKDTCRARLCRAPPEARTSASSTMLAALWPHR